MTLFVDTSAWSLAFRRDHDSGAAEVDALVRREELPQEHGVAQTRNRAIA